MSLVSGEYKYFFNGVKRLRSPKTFFTGRMQWLGFILNCIPSIQDFQKIVSGQAAFSSRFSLPGFR
jgi:hypothetical protein